MFDIGFQELLLIGVLSLLIMGPERLPGAVRSATLWIARLRRSFSQIKREIEKEIGAEEIKQQLHNQNIMESLEQAKNDLETNMQDTAESLTPDFERLQYDIKDVIESGKDSSAQSDNPTQKPTSDPTPEK